MKRLELQTSLLPCGGDTGLVVNTLLPESSVSRAVDLDEDEDGVTRRYLEIGMSAGHQQCLNMMNEGIRSLLEVDCPRLSALVSLNLYSNRVASLEGLSSMTTLTTLNLSSNELDGAAIRSSAPHLGALSSLESLDLSCNRVDALLGLPFLPRLRRLLVPYNRLTCLDGVQALASSLVYLDVRDNRIAGPAHAHTPHLAALARLSSLLLMSPGGGQANPVCASTGYREVMFSATCSLETLDGVARNASNPAGAAAGTRDAGRNKLSCYNNKHVDSTNTGSVAGEENRSGQEGRRSGHGVQQGHVGGGGDGGTRAMEAAAGDSNEPRVARRPGLPRGSARTGTARTDLEGNDGLHVPQMYDGEGEEDGRGGPPEEVVPVMPRFDAVAEKFLQRRRRGGIQRCSQSRPCDSPTKEEAKLQDYHEVDEVDHGPGGCRSGGGVGGKSPTKKMSSVKDAFFGGGSHGEGKGRHSAGAGAGACTGRDERNQTLAAGAGVETMYPEDTMRMPTANTGDRTKGTGILLADRSERKMGELGEKDNSDGGSEDGGGVYFGAGNKVERDEHGVEEQGLLSRLRSVAQEARLEVMDSRLQDLREKQAKNAAGARKATTAAEAAIAAAADAEAAAAVASATGTIDTASNTTARRRIEQKRASSLPAAAAAATAGGGGRGSRAGARNPWIRATPRVRSRQNGVIQSGGRATRCDSSGATAPAKAAGAGRSGGQWQRTYGVGGYSQAATAAVGGSPIAALARGGCGAVNGSNNGCCCAPAGGHAGTGGAVGCLTAQQTNHAGAAPPLPLPPPPNTAGEFYAHCACTALPLHWAATKGGNGDSPSYYPSPTVITQGTGNHREHAPVLGSLTATRGSVPTTTTTKTPPSLLSSDASTQATIGRVPVSGAATVRSQGLARVGRARRQSGGTSSATALSTSTTAMAAAAAPMSTASTAFPGGRRTGTGAGGASVGVTAVAGVPAATTAVFDKHRVAIFFLRWARDTGRVKAKTAAESAEAALSTARDEARRERQAWESLRATLEEAAASREREAREVAEEKSREEVQALTTACRNTEAEASRLRQMVGKAEEEAAAAVLREGQQVQRSQAEVARSKSEAVAAMAAMEAKADARVERLEEQLRAKARGEDEAEEECRRVRAQLRDAESRCRGLQDQVEESRARERRIAGDAEDARRRAAAEVDGKLANAANDERARASLLKARLEEAEAATRRAVAASRESAEREERGRLAATELAELVRQQKAALYQARGDMVTARSEKAAASEAKETLKAECTSMASRVQKQGDALRSLEEELAAERQARRQQADAWTADQARVKTMERSRKELEDKLAASVVAQGDIRAALMVKDKILDDRQKLVKELEAREEDALGEARGWRDRLEALQADAEQQLDASRDEVSELQAQVVALSGAEEQLRDVFKELRRYRSRSSREGRENDDQGNAEEEDNDDQEDMRTADVRRHGNHGDGLSHRSRQRREAASEEEERGRQGLTAVAAVTAAAKAVEEELREQLEAKDRALRYVETELLSMKSLFEEKEAVLRQELSGDRERLVQEVESLRKQVEEATAGRIAAEDSGRRHQAAADVLRCSMQAGDVRTKELEGTLRALLHKYEDEKRQTAQEKGQTAQKVAAMATLFRQLQSEQHTTATATMTNYTEASP